MDRSPKNLSLSPVSGTDCPSPEGRNPAKHVGHARNETSTRRPQFQQTMSAMRHLYPYCPSRPPRCIGSEEGRTAHQVSSAEIARKRATVLPKVHPLATLAPGWRRRP
jgi:hypothetical protein